MPDKSRIAHFSGYWNYCHITLNYEFLSILSTYVYDIGRKKTPGSVDAGVNHLPTLLVVFQDKALYVKRLLFFVEFRLTGRGSGQVSLRIWIFWFFSAVLGSLVLDIGSFWFFMSTFRLWIWMYWFFGYCFLKVEVDWRGLQVFVLDIGSNFFRSLDLDWLFTFPINQLLTQRSHSSGCPTRADLLNFRGVNFTEMHERFTCTCDWWWVKLPTYFYEPWAIMAPFGIVCKGNKTLFQ